MGKYKTARSILFRITIFSWIIIILTLGAFVIMIIPRQKELIIKLLQAEALNTATSIAQITTYSLLKEDYSSVIEHCLMVVKESPTILYVVISRNDGFSLVQTKSGWSQKNLGGYWITSLSNDGVFIDSSLVKSKVFHFSHRIRYSGIEWGWIHIGLSLERFNENLRAISRSSYLLFFFCAFVGLILSYIFSMQITKPILLLNEVMGKVKSGDFSARSSISTGDEIEELSISLNSMIESVVKFREELLITNDYTKSIVRSMVDSLIVVDPEGKIKTINEAASVLLGYEADVLIGKLFKHIIADNPEVSFIYLSKLLKDDFVRDYEVNFRKKTGEIIPVSISGSVMWDRNRNLIGIVCVGRDMRESKRLREKEKELAAKAAAADIERIKAKELEKAYRELHDTQTRLIQSGKMAAIGTLAAGVAHELNNPMSGITINIDMIEEKLKGEEVKSIKAFEKLPKYIFMIKESICRCKTIIDGLLSFSRQSDETELSHIDINEAVERSLILLNNQMKLNHVNVNKSLQTDLGSVKCNFNQIQQVFVNIVLNACQFMPNGGDLMIVSSMSDDEKYVEVKISDTGPGISKENIERVFEPFFTTMSVAGGSGGGTGLGLSISYDIIKNYGGNISVLSVEGEGATFIIKLPAGEERSILNG